MSSKSSGNENEKDYSNFSMTQTSLNERKKGKVSNILPLFFLLILPGFRFLKSIPDQRKVKPTTAYVVIHISETNYKFCGLCSFFSFLNCPQKLAFGSHKQCHFQV